MKPGRRARGRPVRATARGDDDDEGGGPRRGVAGRGRRARQAADAAVIADIRARWTPAVDPPGALQRAVGDERSRAAPPMTGSSVGTRLNRTSGSRTWATRAPSAARCSSQYVAGPAVRQRPRVLRHERAHAPVGPDEDHGPCGARRDGAATPKDGPRHHGALFRPIVVAVERARRGERGGTGVQASAGAVREERVGRGRDEDGVHGSTVTSPRRRRVRKNPAPSNGKLVTEMCTGIKERRAGHVAELRSA